MADDAEKIALIIDTQAQLSGLRQATAEVSGFERVIAAGKVPLNDMGTAAKQTTADISGLGAATAKATAGIGGVGGATERLNPNLRSGALAASRLTFAFDGLGGGIQGISRSIGTLSYGVADLGGAKLALLASGVAAAAIGIATLTELIIKQYKEVVADGEAFDAHLKNLNFASARDEVAGLNKKIGETTDQLTKLTYWQTVSYELYHKRPDGQSFLDSFLSDIRHLVTGTTDLDDALEKTRNQRDAAQAVETEKGKELNQTEKDRAFTLTEYYNTQKLSLDTKGRELAYAVEQRTYDQQRAALLGQLAIQEEQINKEFAVRPELAKQGVANSATEIAQRDRLLFLAKQDNQLALTNLAIQEAARKAAANAPLLAGIETSRSDLQGPDSRLNAERIKANQAAAELTRKGDADIELINRAHYERDERALRDYYAEIETIRRENDDAIANARSDIDPTIAETQARLEVWRHYYDTLGKYGVSFADSEKLRDAQLARIDRDVFVQSVDHIRASAAAAEQYGGTVGAIAKATGDAIRRGELAVNAYKDFGKGKSEGAAAIADAATGNFVGAALHGAASVAYFGAAAFEAAGAIGASGSSGGGGGGAGGGGALNTSNSTFTPNAAGGATGTTVNIYSQDPNSRASVKAAVFYANQAQVFKVPILLPPSAGGWGSK